MVFSSLSFLVLFLPLVLLLYFICRNRVWRNTILLLASLFFYSWGEPKLLILMVAAALVAYLGGLVIYSAKGALRRIVYILTLCALILNLFVFKYLNLFSDTFKLSLRQIALPIGISFYTFQILSYVIDLFRGEIKVQKNFFYLLLYVSFFPQLIAGPIVRYQTIEQEITCRRESIKDIAEGLRRFILGLSKKVLIANQVAVVAEALFASHSSGTLAYWLAALAYTLQIYFDFSGYSDMAIGLGRMFGFHFLENFNYPYAATSVTEFWRRWHISLSTWFRDYVYIPLGGSRRKAARVILNLLIVWGLTGLWHGASWNFLLWGLYFGLVLILEKFCLAKLLKKLPKGIGWLYTMFLVVVGWVIFDLTDFSALGHTLCTMFRPVPTDWNALTAQDAMLLFSAVFLVPGVVFSFPVLRPLLRSEKTGAILVKNALCIVLLLLCIMQLLGKAYNPFIYFRF